MVEDAVGGREVGDEGQDAARRATGMPDNAAQPKEIADEAQGFAFVDTDTTP